ncbi:BT_2262 family domain-containing protein [Saccharicrinis sp. 156]|uniref:BT_2262 family domain-containing protein n=1 Tax=Saccharicrinis sp. 156 TaxID=3417574 RepID=UPI003D3428A1
MKKILFCLFSLALVFQGCEKDTSTEDMSRITNYVTFGFTDANDKDQFGNDMVIIEKGTAYDITQNYTAFEGETDKSGETEITGSIDTDASGYYPINYSAVNADGYSASSTKSIIVSDPSIATDISGDYSATVYRTPTGNTYNEGFDASISKVTDGVFYVDRMLGSYYYDGFGYKDFGSYFVHGFVALKADNTITSGSSASYSPGWRDTLSGFKDGVYDPATGIVTFTSLYAGGREFHVTFTPKE